MYNVKLAMSRSNLGPTHPTIRV